MDTSSTTDCQSAKRTPDDRPRVVAATVYLPDGGVITGTPEEMLALLEGMEAECGPLKGDRDAHDRACGEYVLREARRRNMRLAPHPAVVRRFKPRFRLRTPALRCCRTARGRSSRRARTLARKPCSSSGGDSDPEPSDPPRALRSSAGGVA